MTEYAALGFLLTAYAVIANDSVQTLGTFIESNKSVKWQYQWGYISFILVVTLISSWVAYDGDISQGRLQVLPLVTIEWYYLLPPLGLVILTQYGIPVSTSLLILSAFASTVVFEQIILKSVIGYALAAIIAYFLWLFVSKVFDDDQDKGDILHWRIVQWFATGFLWYSWLSHDIANIAVFLPRQLPFSDLVIVLLILVSGLAYIFWKRGGRIQEIITEKANLSFVKSATCVDIVYAVILLFFKEYNDLPMSTTWVFVGLLAGRELAISSVTKKAFPIIIKDMGKMLVGLAFSVGIVFLL
jgi:hypothetical protein